MVLRGVTRLVLLDVKAGKILVAPSDVRLKMFTGAVGGPYREVGWFDSSEVEAVSADGGTIAFIEAAGTGQTDEGYTQFQRRGDQPATLVGHGFRFTMLPDGNDMIVVASATKLVRRPMGIGTPSAIELGTIAALGTSDRMALSWTGRYLVVCGAEANAAMRLWRIDLQQPGVQPIAATHLGGQHPISPDGATVAIGRAAGGIELVSISGAAPRVIAGPIGESPLSFTADGATLFVMHLVDTTIEIEQVDLATGARSAWTKITPEQQPFYYAVVLSADGKVVTYSTKSDSSDLYVLEPPR